MEQLFQRYFYAVGEKVLNWYNTFVMHCRYHTCYTSANYCSGKSCMALILLFYGRYLVVCMWHRAFIAVRSLCNVLSPKLSNNSVRELT